MEGDPQMTKVQCWPGLTALKPMKRPSRYRSLIELKVIIVEEKLTSLEEADEILLCIDTDSIKGSYNLYENH